MNRIATLLLNQKKRNYTFHHDDKEERILFDPTTDKSKVHIYYTDKNKEEKKVDFLFGWISLGKYALSPGKVKLTLHDKGLSAGQVLVVDAAKWVKRE